MRGKMQKLDEKSPVMQWDPPSKCLRKDYKKKQPLTARASSPWVTLTCPPHIAQLSPGKQSLYAMPAVQGENVPVSRCNSLDVSTAACHQAQSWSFQGEVNLHTWTFKPPGMHLRGGS